ncbi:UNVERIFIED_CONTAM: hypothetical protein FKN15_061518 [Acipenser sinensis]
MTPSHEGDLLDCDGKSDSSPEREAADDDSKEAEGAEGIKKRKRKPYRPGIGGFMVRQRSRTGQGKAKRFLCRKDSSGSVSECLLGKEESWNEPLPDTPAEETAPGSEFLEKAKKRYRKKKNKLEEEAFFGRNLLDTSRQSRLSLDALSDEDLARIDGRTPSVNTNFLDPSSDPLLSSTSTPISAKPAALSNLEDPLAALSEVLHTDDDILGILSDELVKPAGLDVGPVSDDSSLAPLASTGRSTRPPPEEPLGGVLSPELDTMVTDELEGKDVEELFTAVLSPSANQTPQHSHIPLQNQGDGLFPRMPIMNGLMGPNPLFPQIPPGAGPCIPSTFSPIHRPPFSDSCRDKKPQFNELVSEAAGSWAAPAPVLESEADTMSNAQRSTLKWEKEETLGEMATVAPVLYTNMNFPSLKEEFPESDLLFKDPLKPKESEHEQEWKFRQIRKQQKEHTELIEEYRIKQQQQGTGAPALIQGVQSQAPMVPGGPPPVMTQHNFPILPQQMEQHLGPIPGQPTPPRMPGVPGWHPGAPVPMAGLRMQSQLPPHIPVNPSPAAQALLPGENAPQAVAAAEASTAGNGAHVKFDDNNPFSEGFQERERKERLRELQERQRIQLMQEVERQRDLQQRLELEQQQQQQQQGIVGPDMSRASLSQMPYFNSELPHDFMQRLQQQQQQQSMQQGFISPSPGTSFAQGNERRHIMGNGPFGPPDMPVGGPNLQPLNQGIQGANFVQGQPRPPAFMPAMSHGTGEGPPFGMEPVTPLPPSYPGSGQSLIQLYSNIIPEEKGKKKRNRKKKKEDVADSVKAPSTPHSDLATPLTPSISDTASTPTRVMASDSLTYNKGEPETPEFLAGSSTPRSGVSQPPTELERQLSASSSNGNTTHQQALGQQSSIGSETDQQEEPAKLLHEIKLEQMEATECRVPRESKVEVSEIVKVEGKEGTPPYSADHSPAHGASGTGGKLESGNELLKHLLKSKNTPSLLPQQRSEEEEEEEATQSTLLQKQYYTEGAVPTADNKMQGNLNQEVPRLQRTDQEQDKKKQRNKRAPKSGEKPAPRPKKRKKDEDDRHVLYPNTDSLMSQLKQQLSLLPLMEPLVGVNFAHFPPYGSGRLNGENRLTGTFGSASLDGVSDYYSQLIYKQNNLSNPPTPPASLPPTPPPVARQKMVNGFATAEELASKAGVMRGPDVTKGLGPRQFHMPFSPEEDLLARAMAHGPKTVDVPASLPTPPHNNQEELRGQDHCDERNSPDSFVPSSSPESVLGMEVRRYPDLSLVKQEPPDPAPSPVIPILPSCSGKGSEFRRCDVKMEPSGVFFGSEFGQPANCSQAGLVSIAITLNPAAAGNINGVVAAVADLLRVKLPNSYEASTAPDRPPAALLNIMKMQHHHRFEHRPPPLFSGAGSGQPAIMRFMRPSGPSGMFQPQVHFVPINSGEQRFTVNMKNM